MPSRTETSKSSSRHAIIVQARMSSRRFPGKMLAPIGGRPLVERVVDCLRPCRGAERIVVATSTESSDDALAAHCERTGIEVFRGELHDVSARFQALIDYYGLESFTRISGDSPFHDAKLVDAAIALFHSGPFDLVTNLAPRSFPKGRSVEVLSAARFGIARERFRDDEDREHVTPYFYAHPEEFRWHNILAARDYSNINFCVDTPEDAARAERMLTQTTKPIAEYELDEIVALYRAVETAK